MQRIRALAAAGATSAASSARQTQQMWWVSPWLKKAETGQRSMPAWSDANDQFETFTGGDLEYDVKWAHRGLHEFIIIVKL